MKEVWKDIHGYEGLYMISNKGCVKSLRRDLILKANTSARYAFVSLRVKGKTSYPRIARLVAGAFIKNPDNKPLVNHKDGNKLNNVVTNLEWCTRSENQLHAYETGLQKGFHYSRAVLQIKNGKTIKQYESIKKASMDTGIDAGSIGHVLRGYRKTAGKYQWSYAAA